MLVVLVVRVLMVMIQYLDQSFPMVEVEEDKEVKTVPLQMKVEMVVQVVVAVLLLVVVTLNLVEQQQQ